MKDGLDNCSKALIRFVGFSLARVLHFIQLFLLSHVVAGDVHDEFLRYLHAVILCNHGLSQGLLKSL